MLDMITRLVRGRNESLSTTSQVPRIITVTGAAGGVGVTTLAVNLAASLAAARNRKPSFWISTSFSGRSTLAWTSSRITRSRTYSEL